MQLQEYKPGDIIINTINGISRGKKEPVKIVRILNKSPDCNTYLAEWKNYPEMGQMEISDHLWERGSLWVLKEIYESPLYQALKED